MQKNSIVHRDLKPGNLLFDSNFHIKLADFGESRRLTEAEIERAKLDLMRSSASAIDVDVSFDKDSARSDETEERKDNTFAGTPLYVSPEMLNMSLSTPGMDLWALG